LKSGAKVDVILPNLQTAVLYEDYRLCHLLLQYGSNPNSLVYNDSVTVIQYAERNGLKRFVKLLKNKRAYSEELTIQELDMLYKRAHANQDFQLTQKYAEQALSQFAEEIDETTYTGFRNREQILFYYVSALVNQALIAETSGEFTLAENFVRQAIQYEEERSKYPNKPSLGFGDLDEILLGAILERTGDRGNNLLAINDFEQRKSGPKDKYYWLSLSNMAQYYNSKHMTQNAYYAYSKLLGYCKTIENPLDTLGEWNYIRMLSDFSYIQYTHEDSIALRKECERADGLFQDACGADSICYYMTLSHLGGHLLGQNKYDYVLNNLVRIIKETRDPQEPGYDELISDLELDIFMNKYRYDSIVLSNDSNAFRQYVVAAKPIMKNLYKYNSSSQYSLMQQWGYCNFWIEQWQNIIDIAPYYFQNVREHIQNQLATMSSEMATAWLHNTNPFYLDHQINVAVSRTTTLSNQACAAMYNHELFKKGLLLRNNDHLRQYILEANDTSAIYLYDKIQSLRVQREKLSEDRQNDSLILSISREIDNKERLLYSLSHTYQEQVQSDSISWEDIQKSLKPNEVAIEFVNFGYIDQYYALLLRKEFDAPKIVHLPNFKRHPKEDKDFWMDIYQKDLEMYEKYNWSDSLKPKKPHFLEFSGPESRIYEIYGYGVNGTDLYQALWKPLEKYISKGETIYFAPSGVLHQLSIEALPYDATQTIGDMYNLIRLSSTRELAISKKSKKYATATLFGGIQYDVSAEDICAASEKYAFENPSVFRSIAIDTTNRGTVRYLKGTKLEVENISNLLKKQKLKVNVYTATTANEESIKAISGKKQNILHIATHGFFWTDSVANKQEYFTLRSVSTTDRAPLSIDPLNRCGLLFAGANLALSGNRNELPETVQDGILTAKEVSLLDLRETDLVVLSACETGKGEVTGDGVFGLQRAFKMAGVQTIIMSLWPVNDQATQLLMTEFYNNWIGKHQSKREAFRNAQNTVRYSQYDDPVYWAGFVMLD
jgi:CHAT domain-containing protein